MYTARIVVPTIAPSAGGVAAYLASGYDRKSLPAEPAAAQLQTVDVLVARSDIGREKNAGRPGAPDVVSSEIILANTRVLAIDQAAKEKHGQNTVVGKTVTPELKPEQAETPARARRSGTLSLALRSIADVNMVESKSEDQALKRGESVNMVRYGVPGSTTTKK
jgi:pilus assembly protein CpaB